MPPTTFNQWDKNIVVAVPSLPPAAGLTGFRRFRTSDKREYISDGAHWISTQSITLSFGTRGTAPYPAATTNFDLAILFWNLGGVSGGILLEELDLSFFPATVAQSNTNYYTINLITLSNVGAATTLLLGGTTDTKLLTTLGSWRPIQPVVPGSLLTSIPNMSLQLVPTAAPGTFFLTGSLAYRIVI